MADVTTLNVIQNGYRNVVLRFTDLSDGTGLTNFKIYDATASGAFGVTAPGGQKVFPGIHTTIVGLDYDVQDMKVRMLWEATSNVDALVLGNAPEDFNWTRFGGITVPPGLVGATGSLLITTVGQAANSTCSLIVYLRKNVPQG